MFQPMRARCITSVVFAITGLMALGPPAAAVDSSDRRNVADDVRFLVRSPDPAAIQQIEQLFKSRDYRNTLLLLKLETVPQAVWLTGGTPGEVTDVVDRTLRMADLQHAVPVFVAYNIPGRDCGSYSAGGAQTTPDYEAWVNAIAVTIAERRAIVILEPDAIPLLPSDCGHDPTGQLTTDRYAQLNYAVGALAALPRTRVYLDAGNSHWQAVGTIASRLVKAGLAQARGFSLNVSNGQPTAAQVKYGTWVGECISFANDSSQGGSHLGHYNDCASQYNPADGNDYSTWALTDAWYASHLSAPPTNPPHFVIDTSRNGQMHATNATADATYGTEPPGRMTIYALPPYNQPATTVSTLAGGSWCNAPGAGVGVRPTADTGNSLVDAFLWIKTAGESDGTCDSAGGARAWDYSVYSKPGWPTTSAAQEVFDPLWGLNDPAAGAWFPEQALQLAQLALPPL
ncbi:MAG TPA: glycoside hydrolase family 6 protein [Steroidobacteraceae bacterium]|nr:glycoside hydrolase family 6 protein [Steroidobacteraceae bacterium]